MTSTSATSTAMSRRTPARSTSEVANAVSAAAAKRFSAIVGMLPCKDRRRRTQGPGKPAGVILRCGWLRVAGLARGSFRAPWAWLTRPDGGLISQAGSGPIGASLTQSGQEQVYKDATKISRYRPFNLVRTRCSSRFATTSDASVRTKRKPRRSGACVGAESVTACGARSRVRRGRGREARAWRVRERPTD